MIRNLVSCHIKSQGVRCAHLAYRMSCDQYRNVEARAAGQCEICRALNVHPQIDHDPTVGRWAVSRACHWRCWTPIYSVISLTRSGSPHVPELRPARPHAS